MIYKFENLELDLSQGKGTLYVDNKLMFRGDGYVAIKQMIKMSNNNKKVMNLFRAQLSQREACRFSKSDEKLSHEIKR